MWCARAVLRTNERTNERTIDTRLRPVPESSTNMTTRIALLLALSSVVGALQLTTAASRPLGSALGRPASPAAHSSLALMQEGGKTDELSDETIAKAAAAASGETQWPTAQPKAPTPDDTTVGPSEGFDPRVILYVSLPALVLVGQLFFTFSRDALGDVALGPAVCSEAPNLAARPAIDARRPAHPEAPLVARPHFLHIHAAALRLDSRKHCRPRARGTGDGPLHPVSSVLERTISTMRLLRVIKREEANRMRSHEHVSPTVAVGSGVWPKMFPYAVIHPSDILTRPHRFASRPTHTIGGP